MNIIATFLNVSLKSRETGGHFQYNITTSSFLSNNYLIEYLSIYPLFTSKYLNYVDWVKGFNLFYANKGGITKKDLNREDKGY